MKLSPLVVIIALLFCFITLKADAGKALVDLKGTFYGKVTDAVTREPIRGASVYFTDVKVGTSTDAAGNFVF
jgi:hypothetical protein